MCRGVDSDWGRSRGQGTPARGGEGKGEGARVKLEPAGCRPPFVLILPFILALGAWEFLNGAGVWGMLRRGLRGPAHDGGAFQAFFTS